MEVACPPNLPKSAIQTSMLWMFRQRLQIVSTKVHKYHHSTPNDMPVTIYSTIPLPIRSHSSFRPQKSADQKVGQNKGPRYPYLSYITPLPLLLTPSLPPSLPSPFLPPNPPLKMNPLPFGHQWRKGHHNSRRNRPCEYFSRVGLLLYDSQRPRREDPRYSERSIIDREMQRFLNRVD